MQHTTQQQPTAEQTAAALVVVMALLSSSAEHCAKYGETDTFPTLTTDPWTGRAVVYVGPDTLDDVLTVVAGMVGDVIYKETATDEYLRKSWRGDLAEGWRVAVIWTVWGAPELTRIEGDPAADLLALAGVDPADVDPAADPDMVDAGLRHLAAERTADVDEPAETSGDRIRAAWAATVAAAAGEPVSSWPVVVPAPRPPADMLPTPSWALVGMDTAFPPAPVGEVRPLTDPALIGHDPTAPAQLVDLADVRAARVAADADASVTA